MGQVLSYIWRCLRPNNPTVDSSWENEHQSYYITIPDGDTVQPKNKVTDMEAPFVVVEDKRKKSSSRKPFNKDNAAVAAQVPFPFVVVNFENERIVGVKEEEGVEKVIEKGFQGARGGGSYYMITIPDGITGDGQSEVTMEAPCTVVDVDKYTVNLKEEVKEEVVDKGIHQVAAKKKNKNKKAFEEQSNKITIPDGDLAAQPNNVAVATEVPLAVVNCEKDRVGPKEEKKVEKVIEKAFHGARRVGRSYYRKEEDKEVIEKAIQVVGPKKKSWGKSLKEHEEEEGEVEKAIQVVEKKEVMTSQVVLAKPIHLEFGVSRQIREVGGMIGGYHSEQRILLVGEGDFSFSASLAVAFGSASNMIATSLNPQGYLIKNYGKFLSNKWNLEIRDGLVIHGVDATKMITHSRLGKLKLDCIIYNFPHCGCFARTEPNIRRNRNLVRGFVRNAKQMLKADGEIHITHKSTWFFNRWDIPKIGLDEGLHLIQVADFRKSVFPGYHTKYGYGTDNDFNCEPSKTFKFGLLPPMS